MEKVVRKKKRTNKGLISILVISTVLLFMVIAAILYVNDYYRADNVQEYLESSSNVKVTKIKNGWYFDGEGTQSAYIFYPGGKVEAISYAPLLNMIAQNGIDCFLVEMPVRLAMFGINRADEIIKNYDYENWYLGGHSLGGAMSTSYASKSDKINGLILLGAYNVKDFISRDLDVLVIYGSEDKVINKEKIEKGRALSSTDNYFEFCIEGGNHAWFGSYGEQRGDGKAKISHEEQWKNTVDEIINVFEKGKNSNHAIDENDSNDNAVGGTTDVIIEEMTQETTIANTKIIVNGNEIIYPYYVTDIDLYEYNLDDEQLRKIVTDYPDINFGYTIKLLDGVEIDSRQTELDMSGIVVENLEQFIDKLSLTTRLCKIDMCDCGLSNEQMDILLEKFPDIKFIWKINLGGYWTIRTDAVAFSTLKDGTITYRLTNEDVKVLKYCTDMRALDLGHNKVTDISFLQNMPELRILILVDDWAGETSEHYISDLSMLKYTPKLKYLEFFVGDVSDISFLEYTKELVDLNISYNPISDVSYLLNLPKIERLYIEHTDLTEEDYNLLKETYPDAYIVYYGEGSIDQGWREHERYFAMIDMFHNNYLHELFE